MLADPHGVMGIIGWVIVIVVAVIILAWLGLVH
jgi:hypothetical protein